MAPTRTDSVDTHSRTILVVDDEPAVLDFVDRVLRDAGYTTATASGGPEALTLAEHIGPFDLLLTDVVMPGMSGDELARQLRERDPNLKVLYLTGFSDRLFKEKTVLWEDEAFLDKPCTMIALRIVDPKNWTVGYVKVAARRQGGQRWRSDDCTVRSSRRK